MVWCQGEQAQRAHTTGSPAGKLELGREPRGITAACLELVGHKGGEGTAVPWDHGQRCPQAQGVCNVQDPSVPGGGEAGRLQPREPGAP